MKKFKLVLKTLLVVIILVLTILTIIFVLKRPQNNRDWIGGMEILPKVTIKSDTFVINDLRDWSYETDKSISAKEFVEIEYGYNDLEKIWFVEEPFAGNEAVAHTFFIFDFKNQESIGLSIEARKEIGEEYSPYRGIFKQYELFYNWATERDLLSLRGVYLKNPMYMYPIQFSEEENKRKLLISLLEKTHSLETKPEFYNTLTTNCTNTLAKQANQIKPGAIPPHISWILPGYADELLYRKGFIPHNKPFKQVQNEHFITNFVQQNIHKEDFQILLREYLLSE